MQACCPVCDRLCTVVQSVSRSGEFTRARSYKVAPHRQPVCPICGWLATFVTNETPGVDPMPFTASGRYTCLNGHSYDEPIDGPQCTGHRRSV